MSGTEGAGAPAGNGRVSECVVWWTVLRAVLSRKLWL